jgi:hypothetical protein
MLLVPAGIGRAMVRIGLAVLIDIAGWITVTVVVANGWTLPLLAGWLVGGFLVLALTERSFATLDDQASSNAARGDRRSHDGSSSHPRSPGRCGRIATRSRP